jgi:monooxygenase
VAHEHLDVLIVGAGLSGIGAAHHLRRRHPQRSFALLEGRGALGGTWDLFRYPGVRSDSDMHTLGYGFRPWPQTAPIGDGASILRYLHDTVREEGLEPHIRLHHRVVAANWSTPDARWTVEVQRGDTDETAWLTCGFLIGCTGYYRYDQGYDPGFPGTERFAGPIVHPHRWPSDLDVAGRRVVVIGSGATAVTLVPALAGQAEHVTMLQRSPSYVLSVSSRDKTAERLRRVLPHRAVFRLVRWRNVALQQGFYRLSRARPATVKRFLRKRVVRQLPEGYDVDRHFTPRYQPWDQRLCISPSGELFKAIRSGDASVVTDRVETFTERGVRLVSGEELEADVIVTATGLNLLVFGGIRVSVDGREVDPSSRMTYKGMMIEGVPNFAFAVGYTHTSWTLKADLTGEYVGRLLRHMDAHGYRQCVPGAHDASVAQRPLLDFEAGYILRSADQMPKQGSRTPWRLRMSYPFDVVTVRLGRLDDGVMRFSVPQPAAAGDAPERAAVA